MKINVKIDELHELSVKLNHLSKQMEEMVSLYQGELIEDHNFLGDMAKNYQIYLNELLKEHKGMIEFYQELTKDLNELARDFEDLETSLVSRIDNI